MRYTPAVTRSDHTTNADDRADVDHRGKTFTVVVDGAADRHDGHAEMGDAVSELRLGEHEQRGDAARPREGNQAQVEPESQIGQADARRDAEIIVDDESLGRLAGSPAIVGSYRQQ